MCCIYYYDVLTSCNMYNLSSKQKINGQEKNTIKTYYKYKFNMPCCFYWVGTV